MTVFLAGNELELVTPVSGNAPASTTNASVVITNVNRAGFSMPGQSTGSAGNILFPSALTEGWVHARVGSSAASAGAATNVFALQNAEGQLIFRISFAGTNPADTMSYGLLAASLVTVGLASFDLDVYFKLSATVGVLQVYINGTLAGSVTGNVQFPSGTQSVDRIRVACPNSGGNTLFAFFSQIIVADTPTLGARVHTLPLTVSTPNQWTGTPANVTGTSSAGTISEATADEEINFSAADFAMTLQAGYGIEAMVISSRAQALSGSPVTRLQGRTRTSGTAYNGGSSVLLSTGFTRAQHIMPTNPATGAAWTVAGANAAEFGLQAKA